MGLPSADEIKGKWKQQVGAAKIAWGKLTEDELLKSEGHEQKIAGLIQERYAITRDEAEKQVKDFMKNSRTEVSLRPIVPRIWNMDLLAAGLIGSGQAAAPSGTARLLSDWRNTCRRNT